MKRLRILVLVLTSAFLFGCASSQTARILPKYNTGLPSELNIAVMDAFADSDNIVDETALSEWENYMSDLYGIKINLHSSQTNGWGMWIIAEDIMYAHERTGFAEMNANFILQMIKQDCIEPLDGYLSDNPVWNSLPEDYRKRFEYEGHIWAIPKSLDKVLNITSIRTDWLNSVKKGLPTSVLELKEAGAAMLKGDPDGDGIPANNYLLGDFYALYPDILASYGLYVNYFDPIGIAYDPAEDAVVDAMLKPQAKEALQYLKDLIEAGVIDTKSISEPNQTADRADNGLYGTVMGNASAGKYGAGPAWAKTNAQYALGRELDLSKKEDYHYATNLYEALPPLTSEYPTAYSEDSAGYVLIKGTKDPKATANVFVDILLGSKMNFLDCYLGDPSHYTTKGDSVYVMNMNGETPYLAPKLITATELLFNEKACFLLNGHYSDVAVQMMRDQKAYENDYLKRYTKTGQLVKVPVLYTLVSDTYNLYDWSVYVAFQKLMLTLIDKNMSVEDALTRYKTEMELYQVETILQEANANIGKMTSSQ